MRLALFLLLLLLNPLALAADILIFIPEKDAGPAVPEESYRHPTWALWSRSPSIVGWNRYFSIPSGVDWQQLRIINPFVVKGQVAEGLQGDFWYQHGFFDAVQRNLGKRDVYALAPKDSKLNSSTFIAAWTHPDRVPLLSREGEWPADALVVASVSGSNPWDEKVALVRKAGGKAMIVEVPYSGFTMWSRIWLEGKGWPTGVPSLSSSRIPGLIPARDTLALLANPNEAQWLPRGPVDPPDRWLAFGHNTTPVALVFLAVVSLYILGLSVFYVLREQYSRLALILLRLMIISPAALILGGRLTALGAVNKWLLWFVVAAFALTLLAWVVNRLTTRWFQGNHPLWGEFAVGLFVVAAIDPVWSMFSQVIGEHPAKISPEAFGALATYAVGASCLFNGSKAQNWIWSLCWVAGAATLLYFSGWIPVSPSFIAVLAIPLLQPRIHDVKVLGTLIGFFLILSLMSSRGVTYAPNGLISHIYDEERVNLADHVAFLLSPMFIGFAIALIVIGIVGDNFLGHQVRRALAFSPFPKTFLYAAGTFAAIGLVSPLYLHAALATAIAGGVSILFDAVRTP